MHRHVCIAALAGMLGSGCDDPTLELDWAIVLGDDPSSCDEALANTVRLRYSQPSTGEIVVEMPCVGREGTLIGGQETPLVVGEELEWTVELVQSSPPAPEVLLAIHPFMVEPLEKGTKAGRDLELEVCAQMVSLETVYTSGGEVGSAFDRDFIVLKNRFQFGCDLDGYTIQYRQDTPDTWEAITFSTPLSINGYGFLLIALGTPGGDGAPLPTPDAVDSTHDLPRTARLTITLQASETANVAGCPINPIAYDQLTIDDRPDSQGICERDSPLDLPLVTGTQAFVRAEDGCADVFPNVSTLDWSVVTVTAPRNSASPLVACD